MDVGTEGRGEAVGREHVARASVGDDPARCEQHDAVGVHRGEIQVVERRDDRLPPLLRKSHELGEEPGLVPEVEMHGGLVQQHHPRVLREAASDRRAAPLAARERGDAAVGEVGKADRQERGGDRGSVLLALGLPRGEAGGAAHRRDLARREREVGRVVLRHAGDEARRVSRRDPGQVAAVDADRPAPRGEDPRGGTEQRGLPGAVRADQRDDLAGLDGQRDVVDHVEATVARGDGDEFEKGHPRGLCP